MASYLGKISALVSANTAGYVQNLNAAARQTQAFAKTVQSDITRASTTARKSFDSILTPLQRLQRSLEAATGQRNILAFKGIDGAIRNVTQLQGIISSIKNFQVAVEVTGTSSIDDLRTRLQSLSGKSIQAALEVTGFAKVEQLQNALNSVDNRQVRLLLQATGLSTIDELKERIDSLDNKQVQILLDTVNDTAIDNARRKVEQLASASALVARPLADASDKFQKLGFGIQAAFIPAISAVQVAAAKLRDDIENGVNVSEASFASLEARVKSVAGSIARLGSAAEAIGRFESGTGFRFVQPEAAAEIERLIRLQQESLKLTADQQRQVGLSQRSRQASGELQELERVLAVRERLIAGGFRDLGIDVYQKRLREADAAVAAQVAKVRGLGDAWQEAGERISDSARRAQAASRLLVVDQRESDLLSAQGSSTSVDASGRTIQQRVQAIQSLAEAEGTLRLQQQARLEIASRLLTVDQRESDLIAATGRQTVLPDGFLARRADESAAREVGAGTDVAIRQFDQLAQKVRGLRGQIDSLPATIGAGFVPQLQRAEQEFIRLRASGRATAEEIENASNNVEQLAAQVRRVGAAQGLGSFADNLSDTALRGAIGSLQALQQILSRVGATAGSDAARQFDRMRAAIQQATREGTIGSEAFQRELRQISQEAANAAAATGRIGRAAAFREIQRGGDIARGGFDKLSLATQQAAFAIDDFLSATGDFTQKIRAVQNNVTQLAFILGGTTGLFIGLGVAIAAQAVVGLVKWYNGGRTAEDQTKALNDALARQKSLVEDLAQAFESLGDSLTRGIFSGQQDAVRSLDRQIEEVIKKRDEAARERVASVDAGVVGARSRISQLTRERDAESDLQRRISLQNQLNAAIEQERQLVQQLPITVNPDIALIKLQRSVVDQGSARVRDINRGRDLDIPEAEAAAVRDNVARVFVRELADLDAEIAAGLSAGSQLSSLRNIVERRIRSLEGDLAAGSFGSSEASLAREQVVELSRLLERINNSIQTDVQTEALRFADSLRQTLENTLNVVSKSLDGFSRVRESQSRLANEFEKLVGQLSLPGVTGEEAAVLREKLNAIQAEIEANNSAARSAEQFAEVLKRVAIDLADTVVQEASSAAESSRRDLNAARGARDALPKDATASQRQEADRRVLDAERRFKEDAAAADDLQRQRRQIESQRQDSQARFEANPVNDALVRQRDAAAAVLKSSTASEVEKRRAAQSLADAEAELAERYRQTADAQRLTAQSNALDQQEQARLERRRMEDSARSSFSESAARGQELLLTPSQRQRQEVERQVEDAQNAVLSNLISPLEQLTGPLPELADGVLTLQELAGIFGQIPGVQQLLRGEIDQAISQLEAARSNIAGNVAEQIGSFETQRRRPSRAALQAQDVNTQQGRSELNRLLRGDDQNRDQPILQGLKEQVGVLKIIDEKLGRFEQAVGRA